MQITLWLFGAEVFSLKLGPSDDKDDGPGDCVSNPVGFSPSLGDQRWERGVEL